MSYLTTLLELWVLLAMCLLMGRQLLRLLPSEFVAANGFYLAPVLGMAAFLLLATLYGWLSPFTMVYSQIMTLTVVGLAFWFERDKAGWLVDSLQIGCFAVVVSLPILATVIIYGGYNPFTDTFTYLAQAQWLQGHPFSEKAIGSGYYPAVTQIILYQKAGSRMGGTFLLAFIQSLFGLKWSYDAYIPTISLAFVSGCLAIGAIIKQVVPARKMLILALCLLPCFTMNGYIFGAQWGFFPQTFGLALVTGLAALLPALITWSVQNHLSLWRSATLLIPLAICTAALFYAYNEPFVIFGAGIFFFLLVVFYCFKSQWHKLLVFLTCYAVEVSLLLNYEGVRIVRNFFQTLSISKEHTNIGWPVLWSPVQFFAHAFGMKSAFRNGQYFLDDFTSSYLFIPFLLALSWGIYHYVYKKQKDHLLLFLLICMEIAFLLAFFKFRYFSPNMTGEEIGYTFLQFKIVKYAAPFSLALVGIFLAALWVNLKSYRFAFAMAYVLALIGGFAIQCMIIIPHFANGFLTEVGQRRSPFEVMVQLRAALANHPKDEVIYLGFGEDHSKLREMVIYVLYDYKLASDYHDDGYIVGSLPEKERHLPLSVAKWLMVINSQHPYCLSQNQRVIGPFALQPAPFHALILEKSAGSYPIEKNQAGDTWNWVNDRIEYAFTRLGTSSRVKITCQLHSFAFPRMLNMLLKDADQGTVLAHYQFKQTGEKLFTSPWIKTSAQHLSLQVSADGLPLRISKSDHRKAKFLVTNLSLCSQ